MNQPNFVTKQEFLEAAERENMRKEYIDAFLTFAESFERTEHEPFDFSDAMPEKGIEVYSLQSSKPYYE